MTRLVAHLFGLVSLAPEGSPTTDPAIRQVLPQVNAAFPGGALLQQVWLHVELEGEGAPELSIDLLFLEGDVLQHAVGSFRQGRRVRWQLGPEVPYFGLSQPYGASAGAPISWPKPLQEGSQLMMPVLYRTDTLGQPYATEFSHQLVFTTGRLRAVPSEFPPRLLGRKDFSKLTFLVAPVADQDAR